MAFVASRLTLFALISAIEDDLRSLVDAHLAASGAPKEILGEDLWKRAVERLSKDQGTVNDAASLGELLPYIDFADTYSVLNANAKALPVTLTSYLQSQTSRFEKLAPVRNRVMHARPLNYDDLPVSLDYAAEFIRSTQIPWSNLNETLAKLKTDPSFVLGLVIPVYDSEEGREQHNLPTPDFDETGFLGREGQVRELTKLCLGPYPVITIFGEGGAGKTAIALKVAYDLLEKGDRPFDAIVWTTAKAARLTPHEVVQIEGAIADSLGLFRNVADHLAGTKVTDPVDEVIKYLSEFRILLILDNLETVLDARIRAFLEKLPSGSKVLITSRIGLGAFDFPYKLQALAPGESTQLLRAVASSRGVEEIRKMPQKKLLEFCARMKHNAGFIKWFVTAIQVGKRPEEVLAKPEVFLDFCMSNVYGYLRDNSKSVLRAALTVMGKLSQAELAFLTEIEPLELQRSLQELITTNFVLMSSKPYGSSFETRYSIAELARAFLSKHYPPSAKESSAFVRRKRLLVAAGERVQAERSQNPYSYLSITTKSTGDLLIARYLLDALENSSRSEISKADAALAKARELAPDFFEVFRVTALVRFRDGNLQAARDAYETAIELEPTSAPLRLWYASFLARHFDDIDSANDHLMVGLQLDPDSEEMMLESARISMYRGDFGSAIVVLDKLAPKMSACDEWMRRKYSDSWINLYQRKIDALTGQHDWHGAIAEIKLLRKYFESIPSATIDQKMREKAGKTIPSLRRALTHIDDLSARAGGYELLGWIKDVSGRDHEKEWAAKRASLARSIPTDGTVQTIKDGFGFIRQSDGGTIFFHESALLDWMDWTRLRVGGHVTFCSAKDEKGRTFAIDVAVLDS